MRNDRKQCLKVGDRVRLNSNHEDNSGSDDIPYGVTIWTGTEGSIGIVVSDDEYSIYLQRSHFSDETLEKIQTEIMPFIKQIMESCTAYPIRFEKVEQPFTPDKYNVILCKEDNIQLIDSSVLEKIE